MMNKCLFLILSAMLFVNGCSKHSEPDHMRKEEMLKEFNSGNTCSKVRSLSQIQKDEKTGGNQCK